jgi:hypothetical protein
MGETPRFRRKKGETEAQKKKRIAEVEALLDEHEGFHKAIVYYKGNPRMIPTDDDGEFMPHRPLPKNTVMTCYREYTLDELKDFVKSGFVKLEELS